MSELVNEKVNETAVLLANAGELASLVIKKIAGNNISTAVNGATLTKDMIQNLVFRGLENRVSQRAA